MNGAGNDFIIINNIEEGLPSEVFPEIAAKLCERHLSIGADGLMVVEKAQGAGDFRMVFYNSDGSEGEMCGNGARCICRYGYEKGLAGEELDPAEYHTAGDWLAAMSAQDDTPLLKKINELYGSDHQVMQRQKERLRELLACAADRWGSNALISVIRSPGRVNIMGRHVDHQGGNCNLMTIGCETLMAVKVRNDDRVTLYNLNAEFAPAEFSIGELVRDLPWDDWQTLVGSKKLARLLKQ